MRRAAIRRRRDIVAVFPAIFEAVPNTDPEGNHCKPSKISLLIRRTSLQPLQQKGAEKYGVRVSAQLGQAKFIGDTEGGTAGTGTDLEQRDRARSDYERIINESEVGGSKDVWQGFRDRWTSALEAVSKLVVRCAAHRAVP